jgi:prepilin-type N-terminal cleavage/methylation domain-containing protein
VNAHFGPLKRLSGNRGYTFLELVIVIAIISILIAVALDRYSKLLVDVERTSMEYDLGVMRSAIGMQVAEHFLAGNMDGLKLLANSNPMDLLAETPKNYLGPVSHREAAELEAGSWYYDTDSNALIYLVINEHYFVSELKPARARFKIYPVYSEKKQGSVSKTYRSGLTLRAMEPYRWLKSSD